MLAFWINLGFVFFFFIIGNQFFVYFLLSLKLWRRFSMSPVINLGLQRYRYFVLNRLSMVLLRAKGMDACVR